jgi:hypothetical protein
MVPLVKNYGSLSMVRKFSLVGKKHVLESQVGKHVDEKKSPCDWKNWIKLFFIQIIFKKYPYHIGWSMY